MSNASKDPIPRPSAWTISGDATDEEIAAVTAVLTALARPGVDGPAGPSANGWAAHWHRMNTVDLPSRS